MRFTNRGKRVAKEVLISLKDEFIHSLTDQQFVKSLEQVSKNRCVLGVGQSIDVFFGGDEFRANENKQPIEGDMIYSDSNGEYCEHFIIDFNSYPPIFTVDSEVEDVRQEMKKQTKELERLRKELHALSQGKEQENQNA